MPSQHTPGPWTVDDTIDKRKIARANARRQEDWDRVWRERAALLEALEAFEKKGISSLWTMDERDKARAALRAAKKHFDASNYPDLAE